MEGCNVTTDAIKSLEFMNNQIVSDFLSATKHAVKLSNLNQSHSISNFMDCLLPPSQYRPHSIFLRHYNCLSTLLCAHFIKPEFIIKAEIKSSTQLDTFKDAHDSFAILINMLREVLPEAGNYGSMIDPNT